jgi:hypothetical protein
MLFIRGRQYLVRHRSGPRASDGTDAGIAAKTPSPAELCRHFRPVEDVMHTVLCLEREFLTVVFGEPPLTRSTVHRCAAPAQLVPCVIMRRGQLSRRKIFADGEPRPGSSVEEISPSPTRVVVCRETRSVVLHKRIMIPR